jgi:serine phosphatase RsbU (regulator of sigma subunit)
VAGHGAAAAGTGAMLRAAWLGATQGGLPMESIPLLLHRLLTQQADHDAGALVTACLVEIDPGATELRVIRAGHESPLLITPETITRLNAQHGPALGLGQSLSWPLQRVPVPADAALMLFTDGLTERRPTPGAVREFDDVAPRIDARTVLSNPPEQAIDRLLATIFPNGTQVLDDDVAVILVHLGHSAEDANGERIANSA